MPAKPPKMPLDAFTWGEPTPESGRVLKRPRDGVLGGRPKFLLGARLLLKGDLRQEHRVVGDADFLGCRIGRQSLAFRQCSDRASDSDVKIRHGRSVARCPNLHASNYSQSLAAHNASRMATTSRGSRRNVMLSRSAPC